MTKLIKILLLTVVSVVVLLGTVVALVFLLVDPVRYKPAIESVFADQTGLQLSIAGEINWAFSPVFGLSLEDLRLTSDRSNMELASLSEIAIKVEPWALLEGRVEMQEFIASNLHVNWIVDANGVSNWQTESNTEAAVPDAPTPASEGTTIAAAIQQITISNASLAIQDAPRGISATFSNLNLTSTGTNLENRPFPFELSFSVTDNIAGQDANVSFASTTTVDFEAGNARFDNLLLKLNPLQLSGNLAVTDFRNALAWSGNLQSNTFPLSDFLANYIIAPDADSAAPTLPGNFSADSDQFSLQLEFSGNDQQINVPALTLALDDMRVNLDAVYSLASAATPANLRYTLTANALDLDRYTSRTEEPATDTETDDPVPAAATAPAEDTELPIELLQSMNIQANHSIEALAVAGLTFSNINVALQVQNGALSLDVQPIGFYEGQLSSTLSLDTRQTPPMLTSIASARNVNVALLAQDLPAAEFAEGRLHLESLHTLRGRTVNQLIESAAGTTSFNLADNAIDIGIVKQLFSSISVLSPAGSGDFAQQWPDVVSFSNFEGHLTLSQGIADGQELAVTMDNFEIAATGGIDLTAESFNYAVTLTVFGEPAVQTIPVAPLYQGVGWPVLCNARFDAEFSQYCGPDFGKVRDLFVQISRNEIQRRVQDAVTDQVPENLGDTVRGLFDRFLR